MILYRCLFVSFFTNFFFLERVQPVILLQRRELPADQPTLKGSAFCRYIESGLWQHSLFLNTTDVSIPESSSGSAWSYGVTAVGLSSWVHVFFPCLLVPVKIVITNEEEVSWVTISLLIFYFCAQFSQCETMHFFSIGKQTYSLM